jgi:hypothetical protein
MKILFLHDIGYGPYHPIIISRTQIYFYTYDNFPQRPALHILSVHSILKVGDQPLLKHIAIRVLKLYPYLQRNYQSLLNLYVRSQYFLFLDTASK